MAQRLDQREWSWTGGPFQALGFSFDVRTQDPATGEYLGLALAPLASGSSAAHTYSIVDDGQRRRQRYGLYLDGRFIIRTGGTTASALYVLWHVNRSVVRESPEYLLIHASAASLDGMALLFPASMESGKTTLVAGLLQRGLSYLTDEAVGVDPKTGMAHPYPKSLSVDPGSWEVLAALRPGLAEHLTPFASTQWQVDPRGIRPDIVSGACPIALVVSPHYEPGNATRLEQVTRAGGVAMLVENAFNFDRHGASGLDALARIVGRAECYRLTVGSLDDACDAIIGLAEHRLPELSAGPAPPR